MTENDSFALKNTSSTLNGDAKVIDREAQGILGSTAIKLRAATARIMSEQIVEPAKKQVRSVVPSEQEVIAGIKKAPGIALRAIDAVWASPTREPGAQRTPQASKPSQQAAPPQPVSSLPPGLESIWGLPVGGGAVVEPPGAQRTPQSAETPFGAVKPKKKRDEDITLDDILPVPPDW